MSSEIPSSPTNIKSMGIIPRPPESFPVPPPIIPPEERDESRKIKNPFLVEPGRFKDYFKNNPELAAQDFYEVPMKDVVVKENGKEYKTKEIIRDEAWQIAGLPKLGKRKSWATFTGPDGLLYATESTPAASREIEGWEEVAPIE